LGRLLAVGGLLPVGTRPLLPVPLLLAVTRLGLARTGVRL
ncbi:hypothetical protein SAMN05216275_1445, partial [Streptosporangium canum]